MSTGSRVVLRLTSALVGLALVVLTFLTVGQVLTRLFGDADFLVPAERWYQQLRRTPWNDDSVVYTGLGLFIVGILLLAIASAAKVRIIELTQPKDTIDVDISPRAVAQMLRRQAEAVPGVATASSAVSKDTARVTVAAPLAHPDRLLPTLEADLQHGLKQIPWRTLPRLQVEVASERGTATRSRNGSPKAGTPDVDTQAELR